MDAPGFLPFLIGPRQCVGQQYALNANVYLMVRLAQTYSRLESRDDAGYAAHIELSLSNMNGIWVEMIPDPQAPAFGKML